ncbi:hypothetical protein ACQB6R_03055 [Propionibacteriaceae bacterium G1746]|uniref:hypothetical protein n=1 Tax=Aestuariimicrobium sp. G57 TaxID=3418485 RepID=UPI003C18A8F0
MGSGLIFAILVVGWLAYLIPWLASRRETLTDEAEPDRFSDSMTILKRSSDPFSTESSDPELELSTPLTRAAAITEVREIYRVAARRRLRVTLLLLTGTLVTIGLVALDPLPWVPVPWWVPVIPAGLLAVFLVLARFSTVALNRQLDARLEQLGKGWENETIALDVNDLRQPVETAQEQSVELSGPIEATGSLWDPIPVTAPTYVSKPMVPRTVRTIDLSMPTLTAPDPTPVTAQARDEQVDEHSVSLTEAVERPRAVGE